MSDIVENTLKHFGILGMKWGVRRFQNPDGSLTPAGKERYRKKGYSKERYKPTERDILLYGQKGAQRIADRRNRGMDRSKAVRRELGRQIGIGLGTLGTIVTVEYLIASPKGRKLLQKGTNKIKSLWNKYYNVQILDTTGKVIAKYHEKIKYGEAIVSGLLGA